VGLLFPPVIEELEAIRFPDERFSSLGAYVVRFKLPALDELELVRDWIIP